jgi:hypothetical protein
MTTTKNTQTTADRIMHISRSLSATGTGWANGSEQAQDAVQTLGLAAWSIDKAQIALITECRDNGYTWTEIAGWLGISRQAAQQRFGA